MKRVLHVLKSLEIGGVEKSTISIANKLAKELPLTALYAPKGYYSYDNIINISLPLVHPVMPFAKNPIAFIYNLRKLYQLIDKLEINILHYHNRIISPYIHFLKWFYSDLEVFYTHHSVFNDKLNRFIKADQYLAVSEKTKEDLELAGKEYVTVLPNGIDFDQVNIKKQTDGNTIGFVGRFSKEKGIMVLLNALKNLSDNNKPYTLKLFGEGPLKPEIEAYIKEHSLSEHIQFMPLTHDPNEIYNSIDCLVLPSTALEGMPMVIIEAMAWKVPVIASNIGGIPNVITPEKTGYLIEPNDIKALEKKIVHVFDNPEVVHDTAHQHAYENFNVNTSVDLLCDMYD